MEREYISILPDRELGKKEQYCLELAAKGGASVTVHGRINQQDLARLMGSCHIFILPSFYEGLPLVLLEALASGCRIITTDLPGCKELLGDADPDLVAIHRTAGHETDRSSRTGRSAYR